MLMFFPGLFLKAGMQGAELVGLFGDKFQQYVVLRTSFSYVCT